MDPVLEQTADPLRVRQERRRSEPRSPSALARWAWSPVTAYRVGLTIGYAIAIYFGVSALIAGIPAFEITAPEGWTPIWSSIVILAGLIAGIGSARGTHGYRITELVGSFFLFVTMGLYATVLLIIAYSAGDAGRAAVGAGFVWLGVQPGVRMLWLATTIRNKDDLSTGPIIIQTPPAPAAVNH